VDVSGQYYDAPVDSVQQLATLIGTYGLLFKELQHTLAAYRLRCFVEFEQLKIHSLEYREAFAEPSEGAGEEMSREEIRQQFRDRGYSLKQFAAETGLSYSVVTSHFGGKKTSDRVDGEAQKRAKELRRTKSSRMVPDSESGLIGVPSGLEKIRSRAVR